MTDLTKKIENLRKNLNYEYTSLANSMKYGGQKEDKHIFYSSLDPKLEIRADVKKLKKHYLYYNGNFIDKTSLGSRFGNIQIINLSEILLKKYFNNDFKDFDLIIKKIIKMAKLKNYTVDNLTFYFSRETENTYERKDVYKNIRLNDNSCFFIKRCFRENNLSIAYQHKQVRIKFTDYIDFFLKDKPSSFCENFFLNFNPEIKRESEYIDNILDHPVEAFNKEAQKFVNDNTFQYKESYSSKIKKSNKRIDNLEEALNKMNDLIPKIKDSFLLGECENNLKKCINILNKEKEELVILKEEYLKSQVYNIGQELNLKAS